MAATLDRDPSFREGDELPPAWHWLYFHDIAKASDLGPDGHPNLGIFMPPVPLPRRMWAGGTLVFHAPLLLGTTVQRTSVVRSISAKTGRSGPLCFVGVEHTLTTEGRLNLVEEQTIVYRELASATEPGTAKPAPTDADYSRRYALDSTALFRYSALTFNGHRIHYDVDYCREVEGYPNLVIHGPLIATLLLDLYLQQGKPLGRFTYRARSPLFLPQAFTVNGKPNGRSAELWASDHEGGLAMEAEMTLAPAQDDKITR
jgi:3-methylfumaryl-CoA hydratase